MSTFDLSVRLFLQLTFVLAMCRATGWVFRYLGQSQVVSEMIAGVLMGPSLLGWLSPELSAYMFPAASKPILFSLAQLGLALYMFLVGAELDLSLIRDRVRGAAAISAAGIAAPFALGGLLALSFVEDRALFSAGVSRPLAVLFMGASMSVTAFPMLARLLHEQGLTRSSLGTLALAAGSIDDLAAWCVLAIVLAVFAGSPSFALVAIFGGLLYAVVTLAVVRPMLASLGTRVEREGVLPNEMLLGVLCLVMLGAWFTDSIHVYAVFGAFLMGTAMPRGRFQAELHDKLMPLTTNLLLPLFFVYSGLNTKLGLVDSARLWWLTGLTLLAAVGGKLVACTLAARACGTPFREAAALGTLMNARGLMELILLNIGLERGIIQPALFAMLVLMAISTTLMATPLFERIYQRPASAPIPPDAVAV